MGASATSDGIRARSTVGRTEELRLVDVDPIGGRLASSDTAPSRHTLRIEHVGPVGIAVGDVDVRRVDRQLVQLGRAAGGVEHGAHGLLEAGRRRGRRGGVPGSSVGELGQLGDGAAIPRTWWA